MAVTLLLFLGGLNWGLIGLGGFLGSDWNLLNMIFGSWMWLENLLYFLVGLSALAFGWHAFHASECACMKECGGGTCEPKEEHHEDAAPAACDKCGNSPCSCSADGGHDEGGDKPM